MTTPAATTSCSCATIVAHEKTRTELLAAGPPANHGIWNDVEWGDVQLAPPFVTFETNVTVWSDDLRCEVLQVGMPAHTTNDSIVWIPERSLFFCGDLPFNGGTPFLMMGSVEGAIEVLETVVKPLGAEVIVAGHGPVCGPRLINDVLGYLRFVQDLAVRGRAAGVSPLEAARETDLGRCTDLLDAERVVGNLHRAYAELGGVGAGSPHRRARRPERHDRLQRWASPQLPCLSAQGFLAGA